MERFVQDDEAPVCTYILEHTCIDYKKTDVLPILVQLSLGNSRVQRGTGIDLSFCKGCSAAYSHPLRIEEVSVHIAICDDDCVVRGIITHPGHSLLLRLRSIWGQ